MSKFSKHNPLLRIAFVAMLALSFLSLLPKAKKSDAELAKASVMITNIQKTSGGTGVVLRSLPGQSVILTNRHVCGVVKDGGLITTDDNQDHRVTGYTEADNHDLCLVFVTEDLGLNTELANTAPHRYENATVIGHPNLYPTVITHGHFSNKKVIQVNIGKTACTEADMVDPQKALYCVFMGGLPIIKDYESILVTATIMPGSSGSPVYNDDGKIAAVVFAGQGDLGYAFAVPYEYIRNFVNQQLNSSLK